MAKKKTGGIRQEKTLEERQKINRQTYIIEAVVLGLASFYLLMCTEAYASVHPRLSYTECISGVLSEIPNNPLYFWPISGYSLATPFSVTLLLVMFVFLQYNYTKFRIHNNRDVHGLTKWGSAKDITHRFADLVIKKGILPFKFLEKEDPEAAYNNTMLSKNCWASMDAEKHFHALNTLIIGVSGSGKTRFWLKPNLLQMNCSYAITDPKGEILDSCGEILRRNGYDIKVFDIVEQSRCNAYNPLKYCRRESDIKKVVQAFMKNTDSSGGKGGGNKDPFWDDSMSAFLCACIGLLVSKPKGDDRPYAMIPEVVGSENGYAACFPNLCELIRMANKKWTPQSGIALLDGVQLGDGKNNGANASDLAAIFENLRIYEATKVQHLSLDEIDQMEKPYCLREWENFRIAPEKTSTTILMTTAVRLDPFNIEQIKNLTSNDTMDLDNFATHKTALFLIMPATDRTYNFLLAFLYTQLFDILYQFGEKKIDGSKNLTLPNGDLVRWFSREEVAQEGFVDKEIENLKAAEYKKVVANGPMKGFDEKKNKHFEFDDSWYDIVAGDGTLITRRAKESDAKAYIADLQKARLNKGVVPKLPIHYRFLIDEFPNIGEIPEFKEKLATMRGYGISATVICQSITQLKGMYPDDYEVIDANCPFFVFLGGDENTNNEYIAKKIGKTTVTSLDNSIGAKKDVSSSIKTEGTELMRAEDIGRIAFNQSLVFIYGEMPILDDKYDFVDHKNYKMAKEYLSKCGLNAMNFERDGYKIEESVQLRPKLSSILSAIPQVSKLDTVDELKEAFMKTFGCTKEEEIEEKANANITRFSFEEASVPQAF